MALVRVGNGWHTGGMHRKRPCRICRRWFLPDARAKGRQQVCAAPGCQRERHRRACARWRAKNPDYDREERILRRIVVEDRADTTGSEGPLVRIDFAAARDVVGLETAVFIEESAKVLVAWARDAVIAQALEVARKSGRQIEAGARDEIAPPGATLVERGSFPMERAPRR